MLAGGEVDARGTNATSQRRHCTRTNEPPVAVNRLVGEIDRVVEARPRLARGTLHEAPSAAEKEAYGEHLCNEARPAPLHGVCAGRLVHRHARARFLGHHGAHANLRCAKHEGCRVAVARDRPGRRPAVRH